MIGRSGERVSGIAVLAARHDDDDLCCYSTKMALTLNNPQKLICQVIMSIKLRVKLRLPILLILLSW